MTPIDTNYVKFEKLNINIMQVPLRKRATCNTENVRENRKIEFQIIGSGARVHFVD